ncbi:MAG: methyl-viologen-reducing hydrogenase subunit delta, partial [Desulfobacula sp.]|nr:methyl-viologen-reducing hydrogenase subunit delta [Desulfobacula sp.]
AYKALAKRLDSVYKKMKAMEIDLKRLRLTAICTVCNRAFLNEVKQMDQLVHEIGPPQLMA